MVDVPALLQKSIERGAIAPSSAILTSDIVRAAEVSRARTIAELGAGTGAITRRIAVVRRPSSRFLVLERDPVFAKRLPLEFPSAQTVCDCASQLGKHADALGIPRFDSIVSALPWSNFPPALRDCTLREIRNRLARHGVFVTVVCFGLHWFPAGRELRNALDDTFDEVMTSPVVLANLPPAFLYICRKKS